MNEETRISRIYTALLIKEIFSLTCFGLCRRYVYNVFPIFTQSQQRWFILFSFRSLFIGHLFTIYTASQILPLNYRNINNSPLIRIHSASEEYSSGQLNLPSAQCTQPATTPRSSAPKKCPPVDLDPAESRKLLFKFKRAESLFTCAAAEARVIKLTLLSLSLPGAGVIPPTGADPAPPTLLCCPSGERDPVEEEKREAKARVDGAATSAGVHRDDDDVLSTEMCLFFLFDGWVELEVFF